VELVQAEGRSTGKLTLKRPNLVRMETDGPDGTTLVSTGAEMFRYYAKSKTYVRLNPGAQGENILLAGVYDVGFFRPAGASRTVPADGVALTAAEPEKVGDVECEVLQAAGKLPNGAAETFRYCIDKDGLVRRVSRRTESATGAVSTATLTLCHLQVNAPAPETAFRWEPPADAKPLDLNRLLGQIRRPAGAKDETPNDYAADLPKVGTVVPDIDLPRPGGGRLSLLEHAKTRKLTLVNFWFVGCPPCRAEFPHLEKIYQEHKGRGFDIVAVNRGDTEEKVAEFVKQGGLSFNVLLGGAGPSYTAGKTFGVRAYPTNILIDSAGKVLWRGVGFRDDVPLRQALKEAGLG
jgi:thiol-disulfide isomerase/thioredoxin/outer membrane lipoprotein-sorting protein